jgi:hypothetical protein
VIAYAWVNDEDTQRAYESVDDDYRGVRKMLDSGHPTSDWTNLLAKARAESQRLDLLGVRLAAVIIDCRICNLLGPHQLRWRRRGKGRSP